MNLNPETLVDETEEDKLARQAMSGVLGTGHLVQCFPVLEDREVVQIQNRAVCLIRPHDACGSCPHSTFTLAFDVLKKVERLSLVSCPRWESERDRRHGSTPDHYVPVEEATCEEKPFHFCASCPSKREVQESGGDKSKEGWYGRWNRLKEFEDDP